MATLKTLWYCPYLTDWEGSRRQADYDATKMVKALKGDPFGGYFDIIQRGRSRRFTNANAVEFFPAIHRTLARAILERVDGAVTLVPIPNSVVTSIDHPEFRTKELALGIAKYGNGRLSCAPHLVFSEPQTSSRSGGSRDPSHFESVYRIVGNPTGRIVLVDDVLTTGAHLIGACWKLEASDCYVERAITWGRSTKTQYDPVLDIREEELDLSRPEFEDFDF